MYYIIMGLPVAAAFAAVQYLLCQKAEKDTTKLLPLFGSAFSFLLAAFIRGENILSSAVYGIFGQGIFAMIVILWILGGAAALGAIIGWIVYLIKR